MRAKDLVGDLGLQEAEARELARMIRKSVDSSYFRRPLEPDPGEFTSEQVLERANELLHGFGVECVTCEHCWVSHYYQDCVLQYVNMGDTYEGTLIYDTDEQEFMIGSWGGWLEDHEGRLHSEEETEDEGDEPEDTGHSVKDWRP